MPKFKHITLHPLEIRRISSLVRRESASMKSTFALLALVAFSQGVPLTMPVDERIVNERDAKVGEIPYQVSLQFAPDHHFCGGSILNKDYVITAAHCVQGIPANYITLTAGTTDLKDRRKIYKVVEVITHAQYNPNHSWTNDIAVLKVNPPFEISETISYVTLPERGANVSSGTIAVASGWGTLWPGGEATLKKLQRLDVLIASQEYCNKVNSVEGFPVYDSQICAHDPNVESEPCRGDSGGPLTIDGKLVGVASWIVSCASRKHPTVYTRVADFIDWINGTMAHIPSPPKPPKPSEPEIDITDTMREIFDIASIIF